MFKIKENENGTRTSKVLQNKSLIEGMKLKMKNLMEITIFVTYTAIKKMIAIWIKMLLIM